MTNRETLLTRLHATNLPDQVRDIVAAAIQLDFSRAQERHKD